MTPVGRQDLDRVAAVINRLKYTAEELETLHDVDRALALFDKVISEDVQALMQPGQESVSPQSPAAIAAPIVG